MNEEMEKLKREIEEKEAPNKPTEEWTTEEAGHIGGQMEKRLVEEGKKWEEEQGMEEEEGEMGGEVMGAEEMMEEE